MRHRRRRKGTVIIGAGILMVAAGLILTGYNIWQEGKAEKISSQIVEQMVIQEELDISKTEESEEEGIPLYEQYPDMEMPVVTIDSEMYVGILRIPILGLELPIMDTWSYDKLQIAPCRYQGSAYKGDLIIAGHNYRSHFGNLQSLSMGDVIEFVDMDGHVFTYQMVELEMIRETETGLMTSGEWDLTLFTCNYDGNERITIRCVVIDEQ